jgi:acyl-coenzyme A synthetase/AMP-(fatty) acid ligase
MNDSKERTVFRDMLREAATASAHGASVLADPHRECRFPDIPEIIDAVQAHLAARGVRPRDCVAAELASSVPAALTVFALLDYGCGLALLPKPGRGARAAGHNLPAPRFSRWIISVDAGPEPSSSGLKAPAAYVNVRANPDYARGAERQDWGGQIYMRTSGSLGASKLAVHDYGPYYRQNHLAGQRVGRDPSCRLALPVPIFHAYGLGALLQSFRAGASVDIQDGANLLRYLEREEAFEPNIACLTPTFCESLLRGRRSPRPYKFALIGGDLTGESTFRRFEALHGPLINGYGSTEMGMIFPGGDLTMPWEMRCRTVGRPLEGVELRIVPVSEGSDTGELQIKHVNAFSGYVDLDGVPVFPPGTFDGEWFRTGDLARHGPDGTVEVLGRANLSINRNGMLLTFADVECGLREVEGVEGAAVAAGPETIRGRSLVAFCVLGRGAPQSAKGIRAEYARRAPSFAVPDDVRILDELPKLPNGKIDRQTLATMAAVPMSSYGYPNSGKEAHP